MIAPAGLLPSLPARKRAWFFPVLVVGLLGFHMTLCVVGAYIAVGGRGTTVEDDYYNKALHWDDQQAAERASLALGWTVKMEVSPTADLMKDREVVLTVTDAKGAGIAGASIELIYFHRAAGMDVKHATLKDLREGHYAAALPLGRTGMWDIRMAITHGADRYQSHQVYEVLAK